jgi:hypothetical protein
MRDRIISTSRELASFGKVIGEIHNRADKIAENKKWGFWDWVFGPIQSEYVAYLNNSLSKHPDTIKVKGKAAHETALFARGMLDLGLGEIETLSFLGNLIMHNPMGIATSFTGILRHGSKVAKFESSSAINMALAKILRSYRLTADKPPNFLLIKGEWTTTHNDRGNMVTRCLSGLALPHKWNPAKYL